MKTVAVLFARKDSIYKTMEGCDVWDMERDAMKFGGGMPVVAHPPCRLWGELSHMSSAPEVEKETGHFAVKAVQENGGVLEHPKRSKLWKATGLPKPGDGWDRFGGFTIAIPQWWFGHKAEKWTWLYICGSSEDLPDIPFKLGEATHKVTNGGSHPRFGQPGFRPEVTKAEREHTPPKLAEWLVELARRCTAPTQIANLSSP